MKIRPLAAAIATINMMRVETPLYEQRGLGGWQTNTSLLGGIRGKVLLTEPDVVNDTKKSR